jgi:hypothetical protein
VTIAEGKIPFAPSQSFTPQSKNLGPIEENVPARAPARLGVTALLQNHEEAFTPSMNLHDAGLRLKPGYNARDLGIEAHSLLERNDWMALKEFEKKQGLPFKAFWAWLETALEAQVIFANENKTTGKIFPEFAFEWKSADWGIVAGRIDRLIVFEDEAWIIDFKTVFKKSQPLELLEKYRAQFEMYAQVVRALLPKAKIRCFLVDLLASSGSVCLELSARQQRDHL